MAGETPALATHPSTVLARLAARTRAYDFTVWFWGDAIAVDGLLDAAELMGDDAARRHALAFLESGFGRPLGYVDYLTPGAALVRAATREKRPEFLDAAVRLAAFLVENVPKTVDGLHLFRPELPAYRHSVWVDSLYHVPTFLAALSSATGDRRWQRECRHFVDTHLAALTSPRGPLLAHSFDTGARIQKGYGWGRGQGWALLGLIDTAEHLPEGGDQHAVVAAFKELMINLLPLQDASGFWRTLAHDPEAYLEASTAAMIGAAIAKGLRLGVLSADYEEPCDRAWTAMLSRVTSDGSLGGVSAVTWSSVGNLEESTMYKTLPTETNVWGQGGALRFAAERLRQIRK